MKFKNFLVTGSAGYVGSLLVPQPFYLGYKATVFNVLFFRRSFRRDPHFNGGLI